MDHQYPPQDSKKQATLHAINGDNTQQHHALVSNGFQDAPPSYEASTGAGSTSPAPPPSRRRSFRSPRSSTSSVRSHHGLLPETAAPGPEPQPSASASAPAPPAEGYKKNDPMYWSGRTWDELRGKPGCCGSSSGGCCFSSRGGCCFSDRAGCCFSDREGCCFSDRGGCCCGDLGGACCSGAD
ncbi:hypothetical protein B0T10DRAFT_60341 [Thelonectria olida]|uniref:Uncharacterized protein n=1 Tax=Thelonectria olida TaxID=1576542 RepID=A0A9P9APY0_9HYPO|nr:hypothetical protein B0T10DRAFT_60341 [Thelonectria olida]